MCSKPDPMSSLSPCQDENTKDAVEAPVNSDESVVPNDQTSTTLVTQTSTILVTPESAPSTEDLKVFVETFKKERLKMGITQNDVGYILAEKFDKFVSQTTISRFESLSLSYKNMCNLKPMFASLMDSTLQAPASRQKSPSCPKRRIRTVLHHEIKKVLENRFKLNTKPSVGEIADIAEELNLPIHVLRNWFQNRRQREKKVQVDLPSTVSGQETALA